MTTPRPATAAGRTKRHILNPNGLGGPCCRKCGQNWPCDASVLTTELAAIGKRLDRIASVNAFLAARKERCAIEAEAGGAASGLRAAAQGVSDALAEGYYLLSDRAIEDMQKPVLDTPISRLRAALEGEAALLLVQSLDAAYAALAAPAPPAALDGLAADMRVVLPRVRQALEGHRVDERSWAEYVAIDVLPMLDRYIAVLTYRSPLLAAAGEGEQK